MEAVWLGASCCTRTEYNHTRPAHGRTLSEDECALTAYNIYAKGPRRLLSLP